MALASARVLPVVSPPIAHQSEEASMLRADRVREILARVERGDGMKTIARELGVDRNTIKRWRHLGAWQPRQVPRG